LTFIEASLAQASALPPESVWIPVEQRPERHAIVRPDLETGVVTFPDENFYIRRIHPVEAVEELHTGSMLFRLK
jgi:hypothetical protein